MKTLKIIFLLALAVVLALPITGFNWQSNYISELNNSLLAELELENITPYRVDSFIADRIGLHDEAITGDIYLNSLLFDELTHPIYTYGKDGYVFFEMENNTADTTFIDAFCQYLRKMQDYCQQRGVPFVYCINPSKTTVYKEYLPEGYVYGNEFLATLYERLEQYGVNWISNVELLEEKAKTEQVYNVKYDAGHWNDLGQLYGTNHLLEKIASYFPAVQTRKLSELTVTTKVETYLTNSKLEINEEVPVLLGLEKDGLENITEQYQSIRLNSSHKAFACFRRTDEEAQALPRVLFFHGSYYNRNRQFYSSSFQEAYAVHNYQNILDLDYYFNVFQPECVILETAEYATTSHYFDYERLLSKVLNPALEQIIDQPHEEIALEELQPVVEDSGVLRSVSFSTSLVQKSSLQEVEYAYGYLVVGDYVLDLTLEGDTVSCTVDSSRVDIENATVYLFARQ